MPYIRLSAKPLDWPDGRTAVGASYQDDTGLEWVAEVDELVPGDQEITAKQYADQVAANLAHNAAIVVPDPAPAPPRKTRAELRAAVEAATTLPQLRAAVVELLGG